MNENTKQIFIQEINTLLSRADILPENSSVLEQVESVTDPGNLRAALLNMIRFLETGIIPKSALGYSSLPAVIFGLPSFQDFLASEFSGRVSREDITEPGEAYLREYRRLVNL